MVALAAGGALLPENKEQQLKFLDLEFAHVTAACYDLAYVCFHYEDMPEKEKVVKREDVGLMRRAFLEGYLEAMGDPFSEQDIDALLVDVMLAACGHHFGPIGQNTPFGRNLEPLKKFKDQAAALLVSDAEQARFKKEGPEGWLALQGYDELIKVEVGEGIIEAFKFFARIVAARS